MDIGQRLWIAAGIYFCVISLKPPYALRKPVSTDPWIRAVQAAAGALMLALHL